MNTPTPSHEEITRRAQEIWRERGCPEGRDTEIWLEAERQLSASAAQASTERAPAESLGNTSADGGANVAAPAAAQRDARSVSPEPARKNEAGKKAVRPPKGAGKATR